MKPYQTGDIIRLLNDTLEDCRKRGYSEASSVIVAEIRSRFSKNLNMRPRRLDGLLAVGRTPARHSSAGLSALDSVSIRGLGVRASARGQPDPAWRNYWFGVEPYHGPEYWFKACVPAAISVFIFLGRPLVECVRSGAGETVLGLRKQGPR